MRHAAGRAFAAFAWRGHVVGIAAHAEAGKLAVDARPTRLRAFVLFEDQDAGAIAHDEAVAFAIPRALSPFRLIVAGGQRLHRAEAADRCRSGRELGAACDHRVRITVLDHAHCQADVARGGRARGDGGDVRAARAGHDRYLPRDHVDDRAGDVERRDLASATVGVFERGFLDALEA